MRNTSNFSWRGAWRLASFAAAALISAPVAAAELTAMDVPTAALSQAAGPAPVVRLLIGGGEVALSAHAAVIRIGPPGSSFLAEDLAGEESDDPVTCMTQAIYYEARSEGLEGQQAVAQVVVNRTRISSFPSSICGVVYQRTRETSGCQFTFVCDGSMDRSTDWAAWERARAVARRALAGFVFKPMKDATHYHAAWMTPYWSSHFLRIRQIGGHIFYR